jgi:hypothetical protein
MVHRINSKLSESEISSLWKDGKSVMFKGRKYFFTRTSDGQYFLEPSVKGMPKSYFSKGGSGYGSVSDDSLIIVQENVKVSSNSPLSRKVYEVLD